MRGTGQHRGPEARASNGLDTGSTSKSVPVGEATLGRVFNMLTGETRSTAAVK